MCLDHTRAFALSAKFLHGFLFPKYPDFEVKVKATSYNYYKKWIYKPIIEHNHQELESINKKKTTHREIHVKLFPVAKETIKTINGYRESKLRPKEKTNERIEKNIRLAKEQLKKVYTHKSTCGSGIVQGFDYEEMP